MQPLVSICSITYNHAPYIRQCLEGFLMQKTLFPFEIIINDDCSTDGTTEIIQEYAEKFPDIIKPIFHDENQYLKGVRGMFATFCYPRAQGKYIALCEGDDYWIDPLKLQKQVGFLEENPEYSMCGTNGLILWDKGTSKPIYFNKIFANREVDIREIFGHWLFPTGSLIFKREVLDGYPIWTKKIYSGDQSLILISATRGKVYCLSDLTTVYRKSIFNKFSVSYNIDSNRIYVLEQQKMLYEEFLKYTSNKYINELTSCIKMYNRKIKCYRLKESCRILPFLWNPLLALSMEWENNIKPIIKKKIISTN